MRRDVSLGLSQQTHDPCMPVGVPYVHMRHPSPPASLPAAAHVVDDMILCLLPMYHRCLNASLTMNGQTGSQ
jgi:hypothetical protein